MTLLPTVPADLGDGHAVDADTLQCFLHLVQFERLDDRLDFLHKLTVTGLPLVLENISLLVVHAEVQAVAFLLPGDAQADGGVDDLEDGERAYDGQAPGDRGTPELVEDLAGVTVHQAERLYFAGGVLQPLVDGAGGEDAGQQGAQRTPRAVYAEGIERVVIAELVL